MRQLSKFQSAVFLTGGLLMVAGVVMNFFGLWLAAAWTFLIGAVAFGGMQMMQTYSGKSVTIRRLRRIMTIADVLFIVSGLFLVEQNCNFLLPLFQNYGIQGIVYYNQYIVHNNWVLVLFVAAILELYTMHRIGHELEEEAKKL